MNEKQPNPYRSPEPLAADGPRTSQRKIGIAEGALSGGIGLLGLWLVTLILPSLGELGVDLGPFVAGTSLFAIPVGYFAGRFSARYGFSQRAQCIVAACSAAAVTTLLGFVVVLIMIASIVNG